MKGIALGFLSKLRCNYRVAYKKPADGSSLLRVVLMFIELSSLAESVFRMEMASALSVTPTPETFSAVTGDISMMNRKATGLRANTSRGAPLVFSPSVFSGLSGVAKKQAGVKLPPVFMFNKNVDKIDNKLIKI